MEGEEEKGLPQDVPSSSISPSAEPPLLGVNASVSDGSMTSSRDYQASPLRSGLGRRCWV